VPLFYSIFNYNAGYRRKATGISTPILGGNEEDRAIQRFEAEALPIPRTGLRDGSWMRLYSKNNSGYRR